MSATTQRPLRATLSGRDVALDVGAVLSALVAVTGAWDERGTTRALGWVLAALVLAMLALLVPHAVRLLTPPDSPRGHAWWPTRVTGAKLLLVLPLALAAGETLLGTLRVLGQGDGSFVGTGFGLAVTAGILAVAPRSGELDATAHRVWWLASVVVGLLAATVGPLLVVADPELASVFPSLTTVVLAVVPVMVAIGLPWAGLLRHTPTWWPVCLVIGGATWISVVLGTLVGDPPPAGGALPEAAESGLSSLVLLVLVASALLAGAGSPPGVVTRETWVDRAHAALLVIALYGLVRFLADLPYLLDLRLDAFVAGFVLFQLLRSVVLPAYAVYRLSGHRSEADVNAAAVVTALIVLIGFLVTSLAVVLSQSGTWIRVDLASAPLALADSLALPVLALFALVLPHPLLRQRTAA